MEAVLLLSLVKYGTKRVSRYKSKLRPRKPRGVGRGKIRTPILGKLVVGITLLVLMLSSCNSSNSGIPNSWNTYRNPRYGFEFPYPSNWIPFPMPDNLDGRAFRDPQNPSLEIRGWAANKLSEIQVSSAKKPVKESPEPQPQNFTTDQGLTGELKVELRSDISLMTVTLSQGKVQYNWQGQCESKQFADRYRFFYYVARQYRLPPPDHK